MPKPIELDGEMLEKLSYGPGGLMPAVVVDEAGEILMVAYVDAEALRRMGESGRTWFYSRSRKEYWAKGETSGNTQDVLAILTDCDFDTLVIRVRQHGAGACHTGSYSCFTNPVTLGGANAGK